MGETSAETLHDLDDVVVGDRSQVAYSSVPLNQCILLHLVQVRNLLMRARFRHYSFLSIPHSEVSMFRLYWEQLIQRVENGSNDPILSPVIAIRVVDGHHRSRE